jgi:TRAP-type C4-dicarboxylate transport system substrate-binding protein
MMRTNLLLVAAAVLALSAVAACESPPVADKTGDQTVVLTLGTIDVLDPNHQSPAATIFIQRLTELSGGRLKVRTTTEYQHGQPNAESDLVKAIGSGSFDLGIPSMRAFAAAGLPGLQALEAPLVITSRATENAIAAGPVGKDLLATLDGTDVLGLALAPGPLRRPFAKRPLRSVFDWQATKFRSFNSPVQAQTITALGGQPVTASFDFAVLVHDGRLHGAELDIAQYQENHYGPLLPAVTRNVVLWPKITVLTINRKTYNRLNEQQRQWLHQAAQSAVSAATGFAYDEATPAKAMCATGVRFYDATDAELAGLTTAVRPVLDTLAADPISGPLLTKIQQVAAEHPGVDVPDVPADCVMTAR